jgi:hypothetical protein
MNDDNHETRDEYEDRKEQHEVASEIDAVRTSCTHIRVIYRPVGGNAEGWRPVWVCEQCCAEFVPESQVNMAFRAADLRGAQLLMVGSQLADDPKMDHRDRADPRWTPTLHEAWVQREENKRLKSSIDGYRRDIDNCLAELKHKNQVLRDRDIAGHGVSEAGAWEKVARDRFLSVYGATIAVQWAAHVREGRGLDEDSIRSFISEARALAQWTEEVQNV